ncbi:MULTISPECIES: hypothetical protein [unclassified Rathayibacter]|uniref:hypothetical protein n=1 Tax=unclassified Rathayibacter TaxID=2609250 RepID=UPI0010490B58|nr:MULTISPECIES: hypothetical protein [unclassified Rathayibacter]TCL82591.1 hypothetical protein EDF49_105145 [Rathayibacter sp. PhB192]TCM27930.1 hypothetical protein EDF43_105145 [Rathayibacter sp. PhB179]
MTTPTAALDLGYARLAVGAWGLVHAALAAVLVPFALLGTTSAIDPGIDSWKDLRVLSPAVQWAVLGAWLPVLITPVVGFAVVRRLARPLRWWWVTPAIGVLATLVLHFLPYLFFTAPTPAIGG